jgi:hypothetical protein
MCISIGSFIILDIPGRSSKFRVSFQPIKLYGHHNQTTAIPLGRKARKRESHPHEKVLELARVVPGRNRPGVAEFVWLSNVDGGDDTSLGQILDASSAVYPTVAAFPTPAGACLARSSGSCPVTGHSGWTFAAARPGPVEKSEQSLAVFSHRSSEGTSFLCLRDGIVPFTVP